MQHTKNHFFIFSLSKTQTSQLITIRVNKPHINQILKALINQLLNPKKSVYLAWLFLLFPSLPAVRNNITCKAKQTTQTIDFILFLFSSLFRSIFCCLPPSLFYSLPMSDWAFGVAMGSALLLCTWPLKLLLRWEWLFGRRVLCGLLCLDRCGRRRAGFAGDGKVAGDVEVEERTNRWVLVWRLEEGSRGLAWLCRGGETAAGRRR